MACLSQNDFGQDGRAFRQMFVVAFALAEMERQVEHCFANDEQRQQEHIATQQHSSEAAEQDREMEHDDACVRLEHENRQHRAAIFAAANVVAEERVQVTRDETNGGESQLAIVYEM